MSAYALRLLTALAVLLTGCASIPDGPSVMVLPGSGQSFEQFQVDQAVCQQYATAQLGGGTPGGAAAQSGVASAAVGTALGAAAGAALGGGAGGAVVGAGGGLVAGSLVGTGAASSSFYSNQQRYDIAYIQCMYAKGHQVPVNGHFSNVIPRQTESLAPANIPPPPAGTPPPPPPH